MRIRHAVPADIDRCLHLDASFETGRVWQLDLRDSRELISNTLRTTPLPRQLQVPYPSPGDALLMHWQRGYCILVAEDVVKSQILGYVDVGPEPDLLLGWLWHLVVDLPQRRQGIGGTLLQAAMTWSREHQLQRLIVPLQTQNDPAIRFFQRRGFTFCGFNDSHSRGGNAALLYGRNLR